MRKPSPPKTKLISVSQFKAEALRLFGDTAKRGSEYIITKKGEPIARVSPIRATKAPKRGSLEDLISIEDDIVSFDTSDLWEALKN